MNRRTTFVTDALSYVEIEALYFVKMCRIFNGFVLTDFEKYEKNHLAPINMDLKDYSILGASLQIVLP